jgi:multicomponent Na+:H+ antiporter subunit D
MQAAMLFFSALCIGLGVYPDPLYAMLPFPVDYAPYTGAHVVAQLQLLLFSGLAFFVMLNFLKRTLTITLDVDWFYRIAGARLVAAVGGLISRTLESVSAALARRSGALHATLLRQHGPEGTLARTWPTGSMAIWVVVLLLAYLVLYYLY